MNFYQFINILWSRKAIFLSTLMMTVVTALVISLLLTKQYVSTASIMIDQRSVDPVTGLNLPVQVMPVYMASQIDVIASHNVARKVAIKLNLSSDPKWQEDYAKAKIHGDFNDWAADVLLKKHLDISPSRESGLIKIDFTYSDAQFAANAANAFVDAYIKTSIEMRAQPAKLSADWFDSQIASLRERLEHSQSVQSTYEQVHGIVATDDRLDLESARLLDLSKQLVESQAQTRELLTHQGGSAQSLQEVLSSPLIQSLKSELARAEADFAELVKRLDVNHPQYKQAKAQVNSLEQKLQSETRMVLKSIKGDVSASIQRDSQLTKALADQKTKVLELKQEHDEIAVYKREVENAQRAYDSAMQRAGQTRMESEMNQTNISVLNPAIPPQKHSKPRVFLNMILSIFLGGMLGIGSALVAELMDRRVRSSFDISETLGIPVFAVISGTTTRPTRMLRLFNDKTDNSSRISGSL